MATTNKPTNSTAIQPTSPAFNAANKPTTTTNKPTKSTRFQEYVTVSTNNMFTRERLRSTAQRVRTEWRPWAIKQYKSFKELHWNGARVGLFCLIILLFLMQAIATGSTSWLSIPGIFSKGLFRYCTQVDQGIQTLQCFSHDTLPAYLPTVRAMMVISVLIYILCFIYLFCMLVYKTFLSVGLTVLLVLNVYLTLCSVSVFTSFNSDTVHSSNLSWGSGYALCWFNVFLSSFTACLSYVEHRFDKEPDDKVTEEENGKSAMKRTNIDKIDA